VDQYANPTERMDFLRLAEQAGLSMEKLGMNSQLTQAESARCFSDQLWSSSGEAARKYLHQRGFTDCKVVAQAIAQAVVSPVQFGIAFNFLGNFQNNILAIYAISSPISAKNSDAGSTLVTSK
jgi:hypothetical protein